MFVLKPTSKQNTIQMIAFSANVKPLGPSLAVFVLLMREGGFWELRLRRGRLKQKRPVDSCELQAD